MDKQIGVMNQAFKPAGVSFKLVDMTWNISSGLPPYEDGVPAVLFETQGFKDLRRGDAAALNIYFVSAPRGHGGITMGYKYASGIAVNARNIPGGKDERFNLGMTAVHETGHWLGYKTHSDV